MPDKPSVTPYEGPAGGWGSVRSLGNILAREGIPVSGALVLKEQNKPRGFQCVSGPRYSYQDVSLSDWLAHTPPALVAATFNMSLADIAKIPRDAPAVMPV